MTRDDDDDDEDDQARKSNKSQTRVCGPVLDSFYISVISETY